MQTLLFITLEVQPAGLSEVHVKSNTWYKWFYLSPVKRICVFEHSVMTNFAHAQPFRGARGLTFCLKVPLDSLLVWASSEGSGETARMRRLAWTFAARIGDKYQIRLSRPIWALHLSLLLWKWYLSHMSHVIRKPVFAICEQQRRRSAFASAQFDQRLCYSLLR